MLRTRSRTLLVSLVAGLISLVVLIASAGAQQPITVQFSAQSNSGMSGTAVLTPMGSQTKVTLNLQGGTAGVAMPAHIHPGTCATLDPKPAYPLTNVQNGMSETTVNVSIDQIRAAPHAINVHKSPQEASVYVACANLPTGGAAAAPASMPRTGAGGGAGLPIELALGAAILLAAGGAVALRRRSA